MADLRVALLGNLARSTQPEGYVLRQSRRADTDNLSDELLAFHGIQEEIRKICELHGSPFVIWTGFGCRSPGIQGLCFQAYSAVGVVFNPKFGQ